MKIERLEEAVRMFLDAIGERLRGENIEKTPARVAESWAYELLAGYALEPAEVMRSEPVAGEQGLVVIRDIDFQSICLHHLLPFTGRAGIAYVPERKLAGLSKFARLVDCLSRRLQLQERLTSQILGAIVETLQPRGAACLLVAEHQCMSCRGVRRPASRVVTFRAHGVCDESPMREEILRMLEPSNRV